MIFQVFRVRGATWVLCCCLMTTSHKRHCQRSLRQDFTSVTLDVLQNPPTNSPKFHTGTSVVRRQSTKGYAHNLTFCGTKEVPKSLCKTIFINICIGQIWGISRNKYPTKNVKILVIHSETHSKCNVSATEEVPTGKRIFRQVWNSKDKRLPSPCYSKTSYKCEKIENYVRRGNFHLTKGIALYYNRITSQSMGLWHTSNVLRSANLAWVEASDTLTLKGVS